VHFLSRFLDRPYVRLATIGALVGALALGACGRKGPLDPPPGASLVDPQANGPGLASPIGASPIGGSKPAHNALQIGPNGQPLAPKGPDKRIPLDVLLN
jgi:predicted small lipoprotein YifL